MKHMRNVAEEVEAEDPKAANDAAKDQQQMKNLCIQALNSKANHCVVACPGRLSHSESSAIESAASRGNAKAILIRVND